MPVEQESRLKQSLRTAYCDQTIAIRDRKRVVEQVWLNSRRTWMGYFEPSYIPSDSDHSTYSIPAGRRVLERAVVRCVKMLAPKVKWYEVSPAGGANTTFDRVANVDAFMSYVIKKKIKSRTNISQLCRTMMLYGIAVLKTSILFHNNLVWPTQRVVDPFAFYIFPETVSTVEEAEDISEDFMFSFDKYQTFVKRGIVDEINRNDLSPPDWPYHVVERLAYQGITDISSVDQRIEKVQGSLKQTTNGFVSVTEKWMRRDGQLYQVYIVWNLKGGPRITGFFKSQYDSPLYRMAIHRSLPGETYTNAQADDINELNSIQGDLFNQFNDAVNREQGMVAFGGTDGIRRETLRFKGGAKWDLGPDSPKETLLFIQPPVTSTNLLRSWQIANGLMNSLGGGGTIAEGQPGRNMPRSGQAVNNLIDLGMSDIQDPAELIEQEILTPGLSDIYKVSMMIPEDQLMSIPGGEAFYGPEDSIKSNLLSKKDISGDFEFEWVGSLQAQDQEQLAQKLMVFLNLAPQLMPLLEAQGYTLNLPDLIQMIWTTAIGVRGLNKVVVTMQEMQAIMQRKAMASGMPIQPQTGATNLPPEVRELLAQVQGKSPNGNTNGRRPARVPGLNPPATTKGFIR